MRWLSASDAMRRVSSGELDPHDVVQAHLDAIDRFDSRIHAYIHVDRNARTASGVTLAVKDSQPVSGMPWTFATPAWRDRIADEDSFPVARAKSRLLAHAMASEREVRAVEEEVEATVAEAVQFADASPWPSRAEALSNVFPADGVPGGQPWTR